MPPIQTVRRTLQRPAPRGRRRRRRRRCGEEPAGAVVPEGLRDAGGGEGRGRGRVWIGTRDGGADSEGVQGGRGGVRFRGERALAQEVGRGSEGVEGRKRRVKRHMERVRLHGGLGLALAQAQTMPPYLRVEGAPDLDHVEADALRELFAAEGREAEVRVPPVDRVRLAAEDALLHPGILRRLRSVGSLGRLRNSGTVRRAWWSLQGIGLFGGGADGEGMGLVPGCRVGGRYGWPRPWPWPRRRLFHAGTLFLTLLPYPLI